MTPPNLSPELLARLQAVTARRPRTVIDHILKHGYITTEELRDLYGYNHPPRAARDVREHGIPLVTFRVTGSDGRSIGAYKFGDLAEIDPRKHGGRQPIPKAIKDDLLAQTGSQCAICRETYSPPYLQVDHRVPYEIGGDTPTDDAPGDNYMLVCHSCNRAKSWTCEQCPNWHDQHVAQCQTCYWAEPTAYEHIATVPIRRVDIVWQGSETALFEELQRRATINDESLPTYIKAILARHLSED